MKFSVFKTRDPRTVWCAHRSVPVGAIFSDFIGAGAWIPVQDQILSYQIIDGYIEEGRTTPPPYMEDLEIGVISGHDGYYRNYYDDHNDYYGQGQGYDYGQGDYQRPDYDTQQYIKGNFMVVEYVLRLKSPMKIRR